MINTEKFIRRLQKVLDHYNESASSFAEKVGVQRSSISHLLSGRNKPSLDFILKILAAYPEVELYWLLNGKGQFPASSMKELSSTGSGAEKNHLIQKETHSPHPEKKIDRIVIFYEDGTFHNYKANDLP